MERMGYGADIGGTSVKLGLITESGRIVEKWEIPTSPENGILGILKDTAAAIKENMAKNVLTAEEILGIGAGVPGPVVDGYVPKFANIPGEGANICEVLRELTGVQRIECANDANAAGLGELWVGGGKGARNMVFITLGTGVGGAMIYDGKVIEGAHGAGGEIGHLQINPNETIPCGCGNYGCFEQYASATGNVRIAYEVLQETDEPSALRDIENITSKDTWDLAEAGDKLAVEITERFSSCLGRGIAAVSVVFDPEVFVIGGGVSKTGKPLLEKIEKYYKKFAFHACSGARFELATLGNNAGICGCVYMLLDK